MTKHLAIITGPALAKPALIHRRTVLTEVRMATPTAAIAFLAGNGLAAVTFRFVAVLAGYR